MCEFHNSEDIWTQQVTFCISVTINEYFGAWKAFERQGRIQGSVFYGLWHHLMYSCLVTFHVMCGNMYMELYGVKGICRTLRVQICVA
jgi:hypothetical protein